MPPKWVTVRLESTANGIKIEWESTLPSKIPVSAYSFVIERIRAALVNIEDGWPHNIELPERHPHHRELAMHQPEPIRIGVTFVEVCIALVGNGLPLYLEPTADQRNTGASVELGKEPVLALTSSDRWQVVIMRSGCAPSDDTNSFFWPIGWDRVIDELIANVRERKAHQ